MDTLTFPLVLFHQALRALARSANGAVGVEVGEALTPGESRLLARRLAPANPEYSPRGGRLIRVISGRHDAPHSDGFAGTLAIASDSLEGVWGAVTDGAQTCAIEMLRLIGPGMHRFRLPLRLGFLPSPQDDLDNVRWSRTIGALGGEAVWHRLVSLRIAVIGCGRTGSIVAANLARLGVRRMLLIDPDLLDTHNLGEMQGVGVAALGKPKAVVLAAHLRTAFEEVGVSSIGIASTVAAEDGMEAAKACDVLFSCTDNDAARLTTAIIATLHHIVMIDVGTGVFFTAAAAPRVGAPGVSQFGAQGLRKMGADVRVIVPGDGCVLCRGGLSDFAQAVEDIRQHRAHLDPSLAVSTSRAGSLHSLNQIAAGLATRLLEDLVAERLPGSRWVHVEFDDRGNVMTRYPYVPAGAAGAGCLLCARAGLGDEAL